MEKLTLDGFVEFLQKRFEDVITSLGTQCLRETETYFKERDERHLNNCIAIRKQADIYEDISNSLNPLLEEYKESLKDTKEEHEN